MKLANLGLLALLVMAPAAFANDKPCECTAQCQKSCSEDHKKDCKCECGCKETGKCKHGKCHEHSEKK